MALPAVTGLDHFIISVQDIDKAQAQFEALGFKLTDRGFHTGRGSANHTAPFANRTYFELLKLPPDSTRPGHFGRANGDFAGPLAAMLRTPSSQEVHGQLVAAGFEVAEPRDLNRPVWINDLKLVARFFNQGFPQLPPPLGFGTCQHLTPELIWRPEWQDHPNTAIAVGALVLVHENPADLGAAYAKLFGADRITQEGIVTLHLGETPVRIHTAASFKEFYPQTALPADLSGGWFAGATITVASLATAKSILTTNNISFYETPRGSIAVDPSFATNSLIEFNA